MRKSVDAIARSTELVYGKLDDFDVVGADRRRGAFFPALLFYAKDPFARSGAARRRGVRAGEHRHAVSNVDDAIELAKMGKGASSGSLFTADDGVARDVASARRRITVDSCSRTAQREGVDGTRFAAAAPRARRTRARRRRRGDGRRARRAALHAAHGASGFADDAHARHERVHAGRGAHDGSRASVPEVFRRAERGRRAGHAAPHGDRSGHRQLRRRERRLLLRAHGRHRGARLDLREARRARLLRVVGGGRPVRRCRARARCSRTTASRACDS